MGIIAYLFLVFGVCVVPACMLYGLIWPNKIETLKDGVLASRAEIAVGGIGISLICIVIFWLLEPSKSPDRPTSNDSASTSTASDPSNAAEMKLLPFKTTKIILSLNDYKAKKNPVKQLDVTQLTLSGAFDRLGKREDHQDVALDCMGFNAQPPLFDMIFDIAHGQNLADKFDGTPLDSSMHDLCMKALDQHLTRLKQYAPEDLKYFTPDAIKAAEKDNDSEISAYKIEN